jgi:galactose oxidase
MTFASNKHGVTATSKLTARHESIFIILLLLFAKTASTTALSNAKNYSLRQVEDGQDGNLRFFRPQGQILKVSPPRIPERTFYIKNAASGKCLAPMTGMWYDGAQITQQACSGDESQAWSFLSLGNGRYEIMNMKTGLCLDISRGARKNGAVIIHALCQNITSQRWTGTAVNGNLKLISVHSGLFLDVEGGDGALIKQTLFSSKLSQQWRYVDWRGLPPLPFRYIEVRQAGSGRCIAPRNGQVLLGMPVELAECNGDWSQMWQLRTPVVGSGRYILVNQKSGYCLAAWLWSSDNKTPLALSTCNRPIRSNELWTPAWRKGSKWTFVSVHSGLYLDTMDSSALDGAQVVQAAASNSPSQRWMLSVTAPPAALPSLWMGPLTMPIVAVAGAVMGDGKVIFWSRAQDSDFGKDRTYTAIYDQATGAMSQSSLLIPIKHDMFCPGTVLMSDGVLMVAGGVTAAETSFFNGTAWSIGPKLNIARGYNTAVFMADGSVFTLGGSWSGKRGGKVGEIWTQQGGWQILSGIPVEPFLTADWSGIVRQDSHMWLFAMAGGWVFHAGPSRAMYWINLEGNGSIVPVGLRGDDEDAMNGNAVLYDVDKIVTFGGSRNYEFDAASDAVFVIDISAGPGQNVTVRRTASMHFARAFLNTVLLPSGEMVVIGGQGGITRLFADDFAQLVPEIWNPTNETFSLLKPMATPRTYHSIALLLLDGRILVSGGGACGIDCAVFNHLDYEILTPPYLLNDDGSFRSRPVITSAPLTAAKGSSMTVGAVNAASFVLVRMSSVTHSINTDQRRIPLTATLVDGAYELPIPADDFTVGGYYMLFALSLSGTPSIAQVIHIS